MPSRRSGGGVRGTPPHELDIVLGALCGSHGRPQHQQAIITFSISSTNTVAGRALAAAKAGRSAARLEQRRRVQRRLRRRGAARRCGACSATRSSAARGSSASTSSRGTRSWRRSRWRRSRRESDCQRQDKNACGGKSPAPIQFLNPHRQPPSSRAPRPSRGWPSPSPP